MTWRKATRSCERQRSGRYAKPVTDSPPAEVTTLPDPVTPAAAAEEASPEAVAAVGRFIAEHGVPALPRDEAERVTANYNALLKQQDYETKAGRLLYASEVEATQTGRYAQIRTKLLAIPAERAPTLHRLKTVAEVQDYLLEAVTEALEALTP